MIKYIFAVVTALVVSILVLLVFILPTPTSLADATKVGTASQSHNTILLKT
ncbi:MULTISPECIES: hypothetical protein [Alteromonadaceae]|uniref:hypothetical protein n=1 Tax=Alteromonadaceae TaxID=72275 RepID=UPI003105D96C